MKLVLVKILKDSQCTKTLEGICRCFEQCEGASIVYSSQYRCRNCGWPVYCLRGEEQQRPANSHIIYFYLILGPAATSHQPAQSARDTRTDYCHPHFLLLHLTCAWSQRNLYLHYFGFGVQCNIVMYFQPAGVSIAWV